MLQYNAYHCTNPTLLVPSLPQVQTGWFLKVSIRAKNPPITGLAIKAVFKQVSVKYLHKCTNAFM